MDLPLLRVFQRQIVDQCSFVIAAVPMINRGVGNRDQDELWIGCQMFVVGAANVSKLLWGDGRSRTKVAPRRQPLRDSLGITDTSALYEVEMRNNFEHFDQRLDQWFSQSKSHNFLDRMVGPPGAVHGLSDIDRFRVYDPTGPSIVFWGQTFELQPIASEVDRIYPLAMTEAAKPYWEGRNMPGNGQ